jgi:hypothetical protein
MLFVSWDARRADAGWAPPVLFLHGRSGFAGMAWHREYTGGRLGRHREIRALRHKELDKLLEIQNSIYHATYQVS